MITNLNPDFSGSREPNDRGMKHLIFLGFVCALVVHFFFTFTAFYNDDDIVYVRYAADIVTNGIPYELPTSHFQLRWTAIYVAAFFFKLFGVNNFTAALCSFISVLGTGLLLMKIMRKFNLAIFSFSLLLFFFAYSTLFFMQRILPDVTICFAIFWMYYSYRSYTEQQANHTRHALQFSLALMLGIVTKETIILALPLFFILLVNDILKKQHIRFWVLAGSASFLLIFFYLLYFRITNGSFLFRYNLLQAGSYVSACSYEKLPFLFTLKRIGYLLWKNMLLNGDIFILIIAVTACFYRKKIQPHAVLKNLDVFSFLILLFAANFMTISVTDYVPLCPAPRHFLFLFPFAAILGGPMLYAFFKAPKKFLLLPISMILATFILFYLHAGNTKYMFLAFSILLVARIIGLYFVNSKTAFKLCALGFLVLASLNYFIDFVQPKFPAYWDHKKLVERSLRDQNLNGTVFTEDPMSGALTEFFLKFNRSRLQVMRVDSAQRYNPGILYYLHFAHKYPAIQKKVDSLILKDNNLEFILIDQEKNIFLYQVSNAVINHLR